MKGWWQRVAGCAVATAASAVGCAGGAGSQLTFGEPSMPTDDDDGTTGDDTAPASMSISGVTVSASATASSTDPTSDPSTGQADTSSGEGTGTGSATDDASSTSTGMSAQCGDGSVDDGEDCDGDELGDATCSDVDGEFNGGELACDGDCAYDTSGCVTVENPYEICDETDVVIPDSPGGAVQSSIDIPVADDVGTVDSVTVTVELDHTFLGDLTIDVDHGGPTVRLLDRQCSTEEDLNAVFDDAAGAVDCSNTDAGQSFAPADPLAGFSGDAMGNTWTLALQDNAAIDVGTLMRWCVTITWE